jgi:thiol:disulfide interchange protein
MKYLIPLLFLLSCVPEQKRNAEITTMYNGVVEFHANPHWNSEQDLREALTDTVRPDFIIFSADWCEACHVLRDVIVSSGWRDRVLIINMDEKWVRFLAKSCDISAVP